MTPLERFWSKVDKNGPTVREELGPCWIWTACKTAHGYGRFNRKNHPEQTDKAHRVAFMLTFGVVAREVGILHRCDNPPCVNPAHLFSGTHAENMADMVAKGRHPHAAAKLTPEQVDEVRASLAEGSQSQEAIAKRYGVDQGTISHIKTGFTYRWVAPIAAGTHPASRRAA